MFHYDLSFLATQKSIHSRQVFKKCDFLLGNVACNSSAYSLYNSLFSLHSVTHLVNAYLLIPCQQGECRYECNCPRCIW